jgi:hypothetical protein
MTKGARADCFRGEASGAAITVRGRRLFRISARYGQGAGDERRSTHCQQKFDRSLHVCRLFQAGLE